MNRRSEIQSRDISRFGWFLFFCFWFCLSVSGAYGFGCNRLHSPANNREQPRATVCPDLTALEWEVLISTAKFVLQEVPKNEIFLFFSKIHEALLKLLDILWSSGYLHDLPETPDFESNRLTFPSKFHKPKQLQYFQTLSIHIFPNMFDHIPNTWGCLPCDVPAYSSSPPCMGSISTTGFPTDSPGSFFPEFPNFPL